ncbi:MAG: desulfoferrodoxin [Candidatus Thermoplasmatota archaeon]
MTQLREIYKCGICGNIVEVVHPGKGELVCCSKPMMLMKENTVDASKEKHVPVIEHTSNGIRVKVGSAPHPMEEKHYIEWVEIIIDDVSYRRYLKPGDKPEVEFTVKGRRVTAREYCNIHGLWVSS